MVIAVSLGVLAAMGCAIAYALLALLATLALSGAARATEAAHLRTLGLGRRATFWLTIVEHGPTVLLAIGFGIGFGLATFVALRPGLGLAAIVGSPLDFPLDLGPDRIGPLILAILAVVGLVIGLGAAIQREPAAAAALRRGME